MAVGSEVSKADISQQVASKQYCRIRVEGEMGRFLVIYGNEEICLYDSDKGTFIRSVKWSA